MAEIAIRDWPNCRSSCSRRAPPGDPRSVLLVLQGMDTAGKDGVIKHVVGMVDPGGMQLASFKKPTAEELAHDFLWRIEKQVPAPGIIGVFNRSQYEDVLVVRVHDLVPSEVWSQRATPRSTPSSGGWPTAGRRSWSSASCTSPRRCSRAAAGPAGRPDEVLEVQPGRRRRARLLGRLPAGLRRALQRCNTAAAPWYVIPSDRKWYRNWAVAALLAEKPCRARPAVPPGGLRHRGRAPPGHGELTGAGRCRRAAVRAASRDDPGQWPGADRRDLDGPRAAEGDDPRQEPDRGRPALRRQLALAMALDTAVGRRRHCRGVGRVLAVVEDAGRRRPAGAVPGVQVRADPHPRAERGHRRRARRVGRPRRGPVAVLPGDLPASPPTNSPAALTRARRCPARWCRTGRAPEPPCSPPAASGTCVPPTASDRSPGMSPAGAVPIDLPADVAAAHGTSTPLRDLAGVGRAADRCGPGAAFARRGASRPTAAPCERAAPGAQLTAPVLPSRGGPTLPAARLDGRACAGVPGRPDLPAARLVAVGANPRDRRHRAELRLRAALAGFGAAFIYMWVRFLQLERIRDLDDAQALDDGLAEILGGGHRRTRRRPASPDRPTPELQSEAGAGWTEPNPSPGRARRSAGDPVPGGDAVGRHGRRR